MIRAKYDFENKYLVTFNDLTGEYTRSCVYDDNGNETDLEPFMGDMPHLLDIGIMGACEHGLSGLCQKTGTYCYQDGQAVQKPHMSLEDYRLIMDQIEGHVFQVALGGRGDADCHPDFEKLLIETRKHKIVPNITTSGFKFTQEKAALVKKYCGAAAVSWYDTPYTRKAIRLLLDEGVTTNIHFILSRQSISKAIDLIKNDGFPKGIAALVFLLYKPIGNKKEGLVLHKHHPDIGEFFELMNANSKTYRYGFDSCLAPGVLINCQDVSRTCIEPCESGRFSAYIDSELNFYPCSFVQEDKYRRSLKTRTIKDIWQGDAFNAFRALQKIRCPDCRDRVDCLGGCPSIDAINLCHRKERSIL